MVLAQPDTNGGAGHFTRDEAILAALLELIQRDGFLIYWLNSLSPKVLDVSTVVGPEIKDYLKYLRRYRMEYYFLNITTDIGVPSCACVLIDAAGEEPIITVGGGSGFSLKELIYQSAGEALAIHAGVSSRAAHAFLQAMSRLPIRTCGRNERLSLWRDARCVNDSDFCFGCAPELRGLYGRYGVARYAGKTTRVRPRSLQAARCGI